MSTRYTVKSGSDNSGRRYYISRDALDEDAIYVEFVGCDFLVTFSSDIPIVSVRIPVDLDFSYPAAQHTTNEDSDE